MTQSSLAILALGVFALAAQDCRSANGIGGQGRPSNTVAESAYQMRLGRWLRDSTVLDSMTHLARTDSLYRLYRRALEPSGASLALVPDVFCEEHRLHIRYGPVPAERSIHALLDTVYKDHGIHDGFAYFASRAPSAGHVEGGRDVCGPYPPAAPARIGETRLDTKLSPRPRAP